MEEIEPIVSKISRKPNKFRFRTLIDDKIKTRSGLLTMSSIKREPIEWLWEPYIPLGRITMLGGDPGAGKSFITTAISAALTRGDPLPGEEQRRDPMTVLMLNAEDDPADTLQPRLSNLRADLTKIFISSEDIVLDADGLQAIDEMVEETGAKLLIIDPIVAFLGAKMDMNRANEVRPIMKGIAKIARRRNIAIMVVRHNRKAAPGQPGKAIYAGNGSIDFTAAVRSELAVVESKNGNKFMNHIKANSGMKGKSIKYDIEPLADGTGLFVWGQIIEGNIDIATNPRPILARSFKNEGQVKIWIHDVLKQHPDGLLMKEVVSLGQLIGYSQTKLEHAKKGIVKSIKRSDGWYWTLDHGAPVEHDADGVVE